ncbi:uncharacterized protein EI97DRAFT_179042 [Westerdykella ornata]|uniref:BRCT domain-containing protein n=1 Tax=Westerdykella ornata TaxID=318751 RepID=A0A6A6JUX6_WESOR|nr:uncharacterized protein EI97DRAFT_179042 [Westerdykella ornata]KAF2279546.1 hypothetical protein EI97DRAFT_179042 [Westerdykella ornata]
MVATRAASRKLQTAVASPPPANTLKAPPKRATRKKAAPPADTEAESKHAASKTTKPTTKHEPVPAPKSTSRTTKPTKRSEAASDLSKTAQKAESVTRTRRTTVKAKPEAGNKKVNSEAEPSLEGRQNVPKRKTTTRTTRTKKEVELPHRPTRSTSNKASSRKTVAIAPPDTQLGNTNNGDDDSAPTPNIPEGATVEQEAALQQPERPSGRSSVTYDGAPEQDELSMDVENLVPQQPTTACSDATEPEVITAAHDDEEENGGRPDEEPACTDPEEPSKRDAIDDGVIIAEQDVNLLADDAANPDAASSFDAAEEEHIGTEEFIATKNTTTPNEVEGTNGRTDEEGVRLEQASVEEGNAAVRLSGESDTWSIDSAAQTVVTLCDLPEGDGSTADAQLVREDVICPEKLFLNPDTARETPTLEPMPLEVSKCNHESKAGKDDESLRHPPSSQSHSLPKDGIGENAARKMALTHLPRPVLAISAIAAMPLSESPIKSALRSPVKLDTSPKKKTVTFNAPQSQTVDTSLLVSDGPLSETTFFLDIRSRGRIENHVFAGLLEDLGARVISTWESHRPNPTHVLFKDGLLETLEKVVATKGAVKCVNVGFALDCEKHNKRMDESDYLVNLEPARPKTPSPIRRRFAFTPARTPSQFFHSQTPSTVLSTPTTPNSSEWERSIIYDEYVDKENATSLSPPKGAPRSCPPKRQVMSSWLKQSPIKPATVVRPLAASARKRRFESFGGITMAAPKKLRFD